MKRLQPTRRALLSALLALTALGIALPAAASAATKVTVSAGVLSVTATATADNDVIQVYKTAGIANDYIITDGANVSIGVAPGCINDGPTQVDCTGVYTALTVDAGDGNDVVRTDIPDRAVPSTIIGGNGNDGLAADCANSGFTTVTSPCSQQEGTSATPHSDTLNGGPGDDTMTGGLGSDVFVGGTGTNTVSYLDHNQPADGVTATVGSASGNGDQALGENDNLSSGIQNITGSPDEGGTGTQRDTLTGDAGPNVLNGLDGDDTLIGGAGSDTLIGGFGRDVAIYTDHATAVVASLQGGSGGSSGETDTYTDIESLTGGTANDTLTGTDGVENNILTGGEGNDTLNGLAGQDTLNGNNGNDTLNSSDGGGDQDNCGAGDDAANLDELDTTDGQCETVNGVGPSSPGTYTGPTHTTSGGIPGESGVSGTLTTPRNCVPGNTRFKAKVGVKVKGSKAHKKSYTVTRVKFYLRGKLILDDKKKPFVVNYSTVGVAPGSALAVKAKISVTIKKGHRKKTKARTLNTTVKVCPAA